MKVYISRNYRNDNAGGDIARADVERILDSEGYSNIGLRRSHDHFTPTSAIRNLIGTIKAASKLSEGDLLLLQYPTTAYFAYLANLAHRKGAAVAVLVHDMHSLRSDSILARFEVDRLSKADHIIVPNEIMAGHLKKAGVKAPVTILGLWDYLSKSDPIPSRVRDNDDFRVAYVGPLSRKRNPFLWEWGNVIRNYVVDIYGLGFRMDEVDCPEKFYNHGYVKSDKLIEGMTSDFGLIWDGDSLDTCSGESGHYLEVNTPHKLSLYLRAHLPVIIWRGAAMAPFVEKNNLGLAIDALDEINDRLKQLTPEQIDSMRDSVIAFSDRIAAGEFTRAAVKNF